MNATTYGWIVLGSPLAGSLLSGARLEAAPGQDCRLAWERRDRRLLPRRDRDVLRPHRPARGVALAGGHRLHLHRRRRHEGRHGDPGGPAVGADVPGGLGRVVPHPRLLGGLHGLRPRLRALLLVPQLLRVLDAAAGPGLELRAADRGVGVRGRGVLFADQLLVPARHRHHGGHQGLRDQRDRRRGPGDRRVPAVRRHRRAGLRGRVQRRARRRSATTTASWWPRA